MTDHVEFPRGSFYSTTLGAVAQGVGTAGQPLRVTSIIIDRPVGSADAEVTFQRSGGGAVYFMWTCIANELVKMQGCPIYFEGGLELVAAGPPSPWVTILYVDPTVGPGTLTGSWA